MVKISGLDDDTAPTTDDLAVTVDQNASPPRTKRVSLSRLITLFFNNIPSGTIPGSVFDYVISGGVWTADSAGSNKNASMSAISVYINSRTIAINAVTARTFTASKDTYIDVLDNLDGTGTLVYTEVTNNFANSPTLAPNSIRIAIIVTGATTIATAASINQGQEDRVLPISGTIPFAVVDTAGNLICPRDPNRKLLGYRQIVTDFVAGTSAATDVTPLTVPVIIPTGRKIHAIGHGNIIESGTARLMYFKLRENTTDLDVQYIYGQGAAIPATAGAEWHSTPTAGAHTYKVNIECDAGANVSLKGSATIPAFIAIYLD